MTKNLRKGCGLGTPHGEHTWECEDWGRVRCPGRDTGDATGLNAKPCGKTHPHPSHLWDAADATEVFRCFGAMGTGPAPVADVGVSLFSSSGEKIGGGRTDDDGWINLDDAIAEDMVAIRNGIMWAEIGTTDDGGTLYASPLKEGRMSKSKKDYTLGEFMEEFGSKFARCNNAEPHESHAWYNDFPGPGGGKNQWWWCGAEPLRRPHDEADPFLPHKFCGKAQEHARHNWVWDDRPMTRYYCPGEMIEFNPEATLHEGNQPGPDDTLPDVVVDLSPDYSKFPEGLQERLRQAEEPDYVERDDLRELAEGKPEENRKLPVKWADRAMFKAEPIKAEEGPKVYLLWMTPDPLGAIAAACKMYKGEVVRSLQNISKEERLEYLAQVNRTKLKAPFEFVQFHFMIEGVTRSFTHQMVRQRTAAYAQESLRFAVVGEEDGALPVALPPSLSGLPEDNPERRDYEDAVAMIGNVYRRMVDNGVPAEDARGLLPHNIMTRLNYTTNLRALLDHAGNRLCTQAQFEWRLVFSKIVEAIRQRHVNDPINADGNNYVLMANELTSLFKPVCYQTGKCEFKANFDRACKIRDRVDANAAIGRPSSEWDKSYSDAQTTIPAIKPGEWLLDPGAAREK